MDVITSVSNRMAVILRAVVRARRSILTIAGTYGVFIILGMFMAHAGNTFALTYRDRLANDASQRNAAAIAAKRGDTIQAALWDFAGNLTLGALPKTISGFAIIMPYPQVAYQGWIGGIVSVRSDRTSRLVDPRSAVYYLLTLILQVIPYSLAVGAGVNVGIALFRPLPAYQGEKWFGIFPREAMRDLARIYGLVIPLFLVASLWEFLSPWNL